MNKLKSFFFIARTGIVLTVLCFLFAAKLHAQNTLPEYGEAQQQGMVIDSEDSVIIDLTQVLYVNNKVEIPFYILSDDSVWALDFALAFDHSKLKYDSTILHNNSLFSNNYYNPTDSIYRFTSYSLSPIESDTILLSLRFEILFPGPISTSHFDIVRTLLNGEPCSHIILPDLTTGVSEFVKSSLSYSIYPNPALQYFNVKAEEELTLELYNLHGELVLSAVDILPDLTNVVYLPFSDASVYLVKLIGKDSITVFRLFTESF